MLAHHFAQFLNQVIVLPPPDKPVTPELSDEIIRSGLVDGAFLAPAIIDAIAKEPEFLENLRKLRFVIFAGAPLSTEIGDVVRSRTRLLNAYGQTELGLMDEYRPDDEDYAYVEFGRLSNIELQHHSGDLYEAVMVKKPELAQFQAGFIADPEATEIRSRDLFARHPDPKKPNLFIHRGRADHVIVFETGEKINPTSMEALISTHQRVKSALVIGEGRFQSALLVEPRHPVETDKEKEELLEHIWPIIEDANRDCPAHGRVVKSHVLFTEPEKPFARTGKSTISRPATLALYKDAIDQVYNAADSMLSENALSIDLAESQEFLLKQLRELVRTTTDLEVGGDDDNLYQLGMDSLQTLQLSRALRSSLAKSHQKIDKLAPSFIYAHPTLRTLSEGLHNLYHANGTHVDAEAHLREMESILSEYSQMLPIKEAKPSPRSMRSERMSVLLTGSTGSLGSYLLHTLLQQERVDHVYCLNRSADAESRQASANTARGLVNSFDSSRVTFYTCDFSKPLLGLDEAVYGTLLNQVTHIIHNAWTVNFNLSLATFAKTNIEGIKTLIQFSVDSARRSQIFFVSSVGTAVRWKKAGHPGAVPEEVMPDPRTAEEQGYAQSKWISEQLLHTANTNNNVDVCSLRVGQIAGPVGTDKGAWNKTEWFPLFLTSCKVLGLLPKQLPVSNTIDWIPVNILAEVIVELVQHGASGEGSLVYNLVNPSSSTWQELYPIVRRALAESDENEIKLVEYADWVRALERVASEKVTQTEVQTNPAVKLLEFFQAVAIDDDDEAELNISTEKATKRSPTLRSCSPVTAEWMSLWVGQLGLGLRN